MTMTMGICTGLGVSLLLVLPLYLRILKLNDRITVLNIQEEVRARYELCFPNSSPDSSMIGALQREVRAFKTENDELRAQLRGPQTARRPMGNILVDGLGASLL